MGETAIEVRAGDALSFVPNKEWREGALSLLRQYKETGLLPRGMNEQQAFVILQRGYELKMQPGEALSTLYVVNGRVSLETEALVALMHKRGLGTLEVLEWDAQHAKVCVRNANGSMAISEFTQEDAQRAKAADKDTYKQWPKPMLMWRAISQGIRIVCPEVLDGLYTREEAEAMEPAYSGAPEPTPAAEFVPRFVPPGELMQAAAAAGLTPAQASQALALKGFRLDQVPYRRKAEALAALARQGNPEPVTPPVPAADEPIDVDFEADVSPAPEPMLETLRREWRESGFPKGSMSQWFTRQGFDPHHLSEEQVAEVRSYIKLNGHAASASAQADEAFGDVPEGPGDDADGNPLDGDLFAGA